MKEQCGAPRAVRSGERGGVSLKLLIVLAVLGAAAYSGYQYVPVALKGFQFKDAMLSEVGKATVLLQSADTVREKLKQRANEFDLPADTVISVDKQNGRLMAHVEYIIPVKLPGYTYEYVFDETTDGSTVNP